MYNNKKTKKEVSYHDKDKNSVHQTCGCSGVLLFRFALCRSQHRIFGRDPPAQGPRVPAAVQQDQVITRLSKVTAKWLLRAGAISASDVELYEYGIYSFLFTLCPLGLVLVISLFLHMVAEGLLLIIPFILIRKFCGGFHFQSSVLCGIVSTAVLTIFLLGIRLVISAEAFGWWTLIAILAAGQIAVFSPIDSEGRRLTQKEKAVFKRIAIALSLITLIVCAVLALMHQMWAAVSVGSGMILSAALQFPCLFTKNRRDEREGQETAK